MHKVTKEPKGFDKLMGGLPPLLKSLASLCICLAALAPLYAAEDGEREAESPAGREELSHGHHLNRNGEVGAAERLMAVHARKRLEDSRIVAFPSQTWQSIGPAPVSSEPGTNSAGNFVSAGRITALAVDPRNSKVVYAGAAEGGVWKSVDQGGHWIPLTDGQVTLSVGSIALDPSHPDTVYVGTGEANFNIDGYLGAGILKSMDGGQTWVNFPDPNLVGNQIGSIAVSPTNSNVLLAGAAGGIYQSTDGGASWNNVQPALAAEAVVFEPDGQNAWAGLGVPFAESASDPTSGVYHSTNGGLSWTKITDPIFPTDVGRVSIALAPSNAKVIYIGISSAKTTNRALGVFASQDGGLTWTANQGITYAGDWFKNALAVSPVDPKSVVGGGLNISVTRDGNGSWGDISGGLMHVDQHAIAYSADGSVLYAGNDGGVFVSVNPAAIFPDWASTGSTLAITQFYPGFSVNQSNPNFAVGGTQDNGTLAYTGQLGWTYVACGDGNGTLVDATDPMIVYLTCNADGVELSHSGATFGVFSTAMSGITNRGSEVPFGGGLLAADPSDHNTIYWGGRSALWQSTNGAISWQSATATITQPVNQVRAAGVVSADGNTVIFADGNGIYCTTNAKTPPIAWKVCVNGIPPVSVSQIIRDPRHDGAAYLSAGDYISGHVFYTPKAGSAWSEITGNLPNTPVNSLLLDPATGYLYAGTDVGAFMSGDNGLTWQVLGNGLPNVAVTGLQLIGPSRILRASTHGRSMWDISLPVPAPQLPSGGIINSASYGKNGGATGLAPGSIAAVFGTQMSLALAAATAVPLPTALAGANLSIGGVSAPLFYVSPGQLNVQIPWETPVGPVNATLTNGMQTSTTPVSVAAYAPGIFTLNASGGGQGIVTNLDYSFAAPAGSIPGVVAKPAVRGGVGVIFCTGLGPVTNQPATGAAAPSNPLASTPTPPVVTVGGVNAVVSFSGLTPGAVGLYQIDFTVPTNAPTGSAVSLSISMGGAASNTVTMAIQ